MPAAATLPFMKFYTSDWRSEPRLRNCTIAARGLWMEMLCLMHEADHRGYLVVNDKPMTDDQMSVQTGVPLAFLPDLVRELEEQGVFSRTRTGVIYSRRMIRDAKKSKIARKNGRNGGNPTLTKQKGNPASDNQGDKPGLKLRDQRLDTEDNIGGLDPVPPRKPPALSPGDVSAKVMSLARMAKPPGDFRVLESWLRDGIDPAATIYPTAESIGAREAGRGKSIGTFLYLDGPIREAHAARISVDEAEIKRLRRIAETYGDNPSLAPVKRAAGGKS